MNFSWKGFRRHKKYSSTTLIDSFRPQSDMRTQLSICEYFFLCARHWNPFLKFPPFRWMSVGQAGPGSITFSTTISNLNLDCLVLIHFIRCPARIKRSPSAVYRLLLLTFFCSKFNLISFFAQFRCNFRMIKIISLHFMFSARTPRSCFSPRDEGEKWSKTQSSVK